MPLDRVPYQDVLPTWGQPVSNMSVRYKAHPDLRLAFIQVITDPEHVYVVSDEPLPTNFESALAVIERWKVDNGQAT